MTNPLAPELICPLARECFTIDQEGAVAEMRKMEDWKGGGIIKLHWNAKKRKWTITPIYHHPKGGGR